MDQYLTRSQICERLEIALRTLDTWRSIGYFPPPTLMLRRQPRWSIQAILRWEATHGPAKKKRW